MADDIVFNAKEIVKALDALEPGMKTQMVKDMRTIAKPAMTAIQKVIPAVSPFISKKRTPNVQGRLGWGVKIKANAVGLSFKTKASKKFAVTSLVSIVVKSPATALADVAGKGSGALRRTVTNSYQWKNQTRTHRVTTQGSSMIRALRSKRKNNFVYPAVESHLPSIKLEIKLILERYAAKVNRKLN
jgi:hypothetical protein